MAFLLVRYSIKDLAIMSETGELDIEKFVLFKTSDDLKKYASRFLINTLIEVNDNDGSANIFDDFYDEYYISHQGGARLNKKYFPLPLNKVLAVYERQQDSSFKKNAYFESRLLLDSMKSISSIEAQMEILGEVSNKQASIKDRDLQQQIFDRVNLKLHEVYAYEHEKYGEEIIIAIWYALRAEITKLDSTSSFVLAHMFITRNAEGNLLTCFEQPREFWQFILILMLYAPDSHEKESFSEQARAGIETNSFTPENWASSDKKFISYELLEAIVYDVLSNIDEDCAWLSGKELITDIPLEGQNEAAMLSRYSLELHNIKTIKQVLELDCIKEELIKRFATDKIALIEEYLYLSFNAEATTISHDIKEVEKQLLAKIDSYFLAQYTQLQHRVARYQVIFEILTEIQQLMDIKIQIAEKRNALAEQEELKQQKIKYQSLLGDSIINSQQMLPSIEQMIKKTAKRPLTHCITVETSTDLQVKKALSDIRDNLKQQEPDLKHQLAQLLQAENEQKRMEEQQKIIADLKNNFTQEVEFRFEAHRIIAPNDKAALLDDVKAKIKSLDSLEAQAKLFDKMVKCIDKKEHSGRDLSNTLYLNWHRNAKFDAVFGKHYTKSYLQTLGDIRQNALRILKQRVAAEDEPTEKVKLLEWALQQRLFTQRRSNYATIKTNVATFFHLPCRMTTTEREIRQLLGSIQPQVSAENVGNPLRLTA